MDHECAVMPIKQQYLIAFAIVALVAAMVVFAMFDYFSDKSRYAQTIEMQGIKGGFPYLTRTNTTTPSVYPCPGCGWRGQCLANGRCPNCYSPVTGLVNSAADAQTPSWQNGDLANANVTANSQCTVCGWRGRCMANGRCPNCFTTTGGRWNGPRNADPTQAGNASFQWLFKQPRNTAPMRPALCCPRCDFVMNLNGVAPTNSVRCPKCASCLTNANGAGHGTNTGQMVQ